MRVPHTFQTLFSYKQTGRKKSASILQELHCIQDIKSKPLHPGIARFLDAVLLDGVFQTGAEFCSAEAPFGALKHLSEAVKR